jgi:hypothetical protein
MTKRKNAALSCRDGQQCEFDTGLNYDHDDAILIPAIINHCGDSYNCFMAHRQTAITNYGADQVNVVAGRQGVWRKIYNRVHQLKKTKLYDDDQALAACKAEHEPTVQQKEVIAMRDREARLTDIEALLQSVSDKSAAREVELLSRITALETANLKLLSHVTIVTSWTEWLKQEMLIWQRKQGDDFVMLAGQDHLLWMQITEKLSKLSKATTASELRGGSELKQHDVESPSIWVEKVLQLREHDERDEEKQRLATPEAYMGRDTISSGSPHALHLTIESERLNEVDYLYEQREL